MSASLPLQPAEDAGGPLLVFSGSGPEDVCHAKQLWNSLSLQPPLESRLVSADIRQRLPVSRLHRGGAPASRARPPGPGPGPGPPVVFPERQREEERRRYAAMADQRREILAMLRRQRELRLQKELLSDGHRYRPRGRGRPETPEGPERLQERELVRQLQ